MEGRAGKRRSEERKSAQAILGCFKDVKDWSVITGIDTLDTMITPADAPSFFERITKDIEIVRVALLLTGCVQGIRNTVQEYLASFTQYDWVWKQDKEEAYKEFSKDLPALEDYEAKLHYFGFVDTEIESIHSIYNIGALSLNTRNLKAALKHECSQWKVTFSDNLHVEAREKLEGLTEYMRVTYNLLQRDQNDLDALRFLMNLLRTVRERESSIKLEIDPVMEMYQMLEY